MIQAIVFDMDGVLIESEETWSRVRAGVVARHGGHWTEADQRNVMGDNSRQWSSYITRTWRLTVSPEQIFREVLDDMMASYNSGLRVLPGAVSAVTRMGERYPLAVASSSPRELIETALRLTGLRDAFQVLSSSDDVEHGKPSPDVYLLAARRLNVSASTCAAIEDSSNGIRSAVAAGMATIAVPHAAYPPAHEALALARRVLAHLDELSLSLVESLDRD